MVRRAGKPRIPERDEYDAEPGTAPVAEVAWDDVERRLADEQNYWLVTTRADGPAHAIAIWAVWVERALWFTSNPDTASAKHLASEPRALAHLESGSEPVVLEGRVDRPAPEAVPERVVEAYRVKYGWRLDPKDSGMPYHVLRPEVARAWRAEDVRASVVRWQFDR